MILTENQRQSLPARRITVGMADDWKYELEDLEDDDDTATEDSDSGQATAIFGENTSRDIEPGSPTFENALFVLVGVALTLLVILGV